MKYTSEQFFLSIPGKVHLEGLVQFFRYIRYNNNLGLKYYADITDALVSDLLRQVSIKTYNQLVGFFDSN